MSRVRVLPRKASLVSSEGDVGLTIPTPMGKRIQIISLELKP